MTRPSASNSTARMSKPRRTKPSGRSRSGSARIFRSLLLASAGLPAGRKLPRLHGGDRRRAGACRIVQAQARHRHAACKHPERARSEGARDGDGTARCRPAGTGAPRTIPIPHSGSRPTRSAFTAAAFRLQRAGQATRRHPAMRVNLDACIQCGLCVRACREVQVNDVIGMAYRNAASKIVFDFDDPMGAVHLRRLRRMRTGLPDGRADAFGPISTTNQTRTVWPDRKVDSLCPFCGVGCQVTYQVKDDQIIYAEGRDGPANHNRLCVKGRFGFDYIHHPHRLTKPLVRLADMPEGRQSTKSIRPIHGRISARPLGRKRSTSQAAARQMHARRLRPQGARGLRIRQGLQRGGLPVPEAGTHRFRVEQCRPLHAPLPRIIGRGADGGAELRCGLSSLRGGARRRGDHRHRRQSDRSIIRSLRPLSRMRYQAWRQARCHGSARASRCRVTPSHHLGIQAGQ